MNIPQLYNSFQKLSRIFFELVVRGNGLGKSFYIHPFGILVFLNGLRVGERGRAAYNQVV